jgi:CRP/FNR family transcriptional regulator
MTQQEVSQILRQLSASLVSEIQETASVTTIPKNTEILREGQYVKVIPLVLSGLVKVVSRQEEKELLLYYIKPAESCVMSFAAGLNQGPSQVFAVTETDTTALLLPTEQVIGWTRQHPDFANLFFAQYQLRYTEMLDTISHLLFDKMDKRLYDYLKQKSELTGENPLIISHRQIAQELGTAREVVSRVMKKLENEGKVKQHHQSIEIF